MSTIKPYDPAACAELVRKVRTTSLTGSRTALQFLVDLADALEAARHEIEVRDRALNGACRNMKCSTCDYRGNCPRTAFFKSDCCVNHIIAQARRELEPREVERGAGEEL